MPLNFYTRTTCRLCNSTGLLCVLSLKSTPLEDDYLPKIRAAQSLQKFPLKVMLCQECGNAQLSNVIMPESIYDNHYIYQTSSSPGLKEHFEKVCKHLIEKTHLPANSCVVDIGCNDGILLEHFRNMNMQIIGVEPSIVAEIAKKKNLQIYQSFFDANTAQSILSEHGKISLITASNVVANIDDLDRFIETVKILMGRNSVFVIETGYWGSLVKNSVFDFIYHEHLNYFTIKSLSIFFKKHDMHLFDVELVETKGGSARMYVQLNHGNHNEFSSVSEFIKTEENDELFQIETYERFYNRLETAKTKCHQLLDNLGAQKEVIAGYGASTSVTTLLHLFELGDRIHFLVDDNPLKHNTVSPGYHLPVYPSTALCEYSIKYALILPWRFSESIVSRNRVFMENGGRFLEVYPEPSLVKTQHFVASVS